MSNLEAVLQTWIQLTLPDPDLDSESGSVTLYFPYYAPLSELLQNAKLIGIID